MGTRSENRAGERARGCIMRAARGGQRAFQSPGTRYLAPRTSVLNPQSSALSPHSSMVVRAGTAPRRGVSPFRERGCHENPR